MLISSFPILILLYYLCYINSRIILKLPKLVVFILVIMLMSTGMYFSILGSIMYEKSGINIYVISYYIFSILYYFSGAKLTTLR